MEELEFQIKFSFLELKNFDKFEKREDIQLQIKKNIDLNRTQEIIDNNLIQVISDAEFIGNRIKLTYTHKCFMVFFLN